MCPSRHCRVVYILHVSSPGACMQKGCVNICCYMIKEAGRGLKRLCLTLHTVRPHAAALELHTLRRAARSGMDPWSPTFMPPLAGRSWK
jgi:hypothetical protein